MKLFLLLLAITIVSARQSSDLPLIEGPIAGVTDVSYFVDEPGPRHKSVSGKHITSFSEVQLTPFMDRIQGIAKRFIQGPLTPVTEVEYFVDEPRAKHKAVSGKHIDKFSEVHLTPYIDLISGIPIARREAYQNIIPYRKRMQAQGGMLRSAAMKGKRHMRVAPSSGSASQIIGQSEVLNKRNVPLTGRSRMWKRELGFRGKPEAEALGSLGSQFYILVYGKRESSFPGNRLPVTEFLAAAKRDTLEGIPRSGVPIRKFLNYGKRIKSFPWNRLPVTQLLTAAKRGIPMTGAPIRKFRVYGKRVTLGGIPRTGAPIRKFLVHTDEDVQSVALFKSLPNIILAVNEKLHKNVFRPLLDPNASKYPPINEGIEEKLRQTPRLVF